MHRLALSGFRKGQRIEFTVLDTGDGARCFGKLEEGIGVFVIGPTAVGDRVEAQVTKIKPNYLEATLRRVVSPSSQRVNPPCAHFGICGGCKWQHVNYAEQLRIKRKLVSDALEHIGGMADVFVKEPVPSPLVWGYRNKIEFSFCDRRYLTAEEMQSDSPKKPTDFALGFHVPERFDKVIDIDHCHLAPPEMNEALDLAKNFARARGLSLYNPRRHEGFLRNLVLRKAFATGELMVYLVTSAYDATIVNDFAQALESHLGTRLTTVVNGVTTRRNTVARGELDYVVRGRGVIIERLGELEFEISPTSFFQTNTAQAERLYDEALRAADLTGDDVVHDLYCGTGTITLWFAPHCRQALGFEVEASAVRDADANARRNRISNARFCTLDLKHYAHAVRELSADMRPTVVVVDPPRAGLHPDLVEALRALRPRKIVYVSCNPASLARDARALCDGGLYRLGPVQPVDLFPHTGHIESVARLDLA